MVLQYTIVNSNKDRRDCDRIVVKFTTTFAITTTFISSNPAHDVLDTPVCDKVCG